MQKILQITFPVLAPLPMPYIRVDKLLVAADGLLAFSTIFFAVCSRPTALLPFILYFCSFVFQVLCSVKNACFFPQITTYIVVPTIPLYYLTVGWSGIKLRFSHLVMPAETGTIGFYSNTMKNNPGYISHWDNFAMKRDFSSYSLGIRCTVFPIFLL